MTVIYHITTSDAWAAAQAAGEYEAPSLADEGFIHCSEDEAQTLRVVQRLYSGATGLIVLDVDVIRLKAEVKREPSRSGETIPPYLRQDKPRRRRPHPRPDAGSRRPTPAVTKIPSPRGKVLT